MGLAGRKLEPVELSKKAQAIVIENGSTSGTRSDARIAVSVRLCVVARAHDRK
jgi:hypothetical protein